MFSLQDLEQFPSLLHRFSEKVIEVKDIELLVEVLDLMIDSSQVDLFLSVFKEGLKLLQNAGQLEEFLFVLRDFYDSIEDHKKSMRVQEIMKSHQKKDPNKKVVKDDPILIEIKSLI